VVPNVLKVYLSLFSFEAEYFYCPQLEFHHNHGLIPIPTDHWKKQENIIVLSSTLEIQKID